MVVSAEDIQKSDKGSGPGGVFERRAVADLLKHGMGDEFVRKPIVCELFKHLSSLTAIALSLRSKRPGAKRLLILQQTA